MDGWTDWPAVFAEFDALLGELGAVESAPIWHCRECKADFYDRKAMEAHTRTSAPECFKGEYCPLIAYRNQAIPATEDTAGLIAPVARGSLPNTFAAAGAGSLPAGSSSVARWEYDGNDMSQCPDGDYVRYADYVAMLGRLSAASLAVEPTPDPLADVRWICGHCTTVNGSDDSACLGCKCLRYGVEVHADR